MSLPHVNLLLESLPAATRATLLSRLEPVSLPLRTVLFAEESSPRYVHFLTSGVASLVTGMETGDAVEVGLTGREGLPEKIHLLGPQIGSTRCFMQVAGSGLRMDFKQFQEEFFANPALLCAVHRDIQYEALARAQLGACNRLHDVEERLARWLLMVHDRVGGPVLQLTQEFLGEMLGARRPTVNLVAGILQRSGAIRYSRGKITIDSKEVLEGMACECYPIIGRFFHNLYKQLPQAEA